MTHHAIYCLTDQPDHMIFDRQLMEDGTGGLPRTTVRDYEPLAIVVTDGMVVADPSPAEYGLVSYELIVGNNSYNAQQTLFETPAGVTIVWGRMGILE